jgi:hypothetical protein
VDDLTQGSRELLEEVIRTCESYIRPDDKDTALDVISAISVDSASYLDYLLDLSERAKAALADLDRLRS